MAGLSSWVNPATWILERITVAMLNARIRDQFLVLDPSIRQRCSAYHNTTQTIATTASTLVQLNSEDVDIGPMHDLVTNNSRLTVPSGGDGVYLVLGQVLSDGAVASGNLYITKNGVNQVNTFFGSGARTIPVFGLIAASAGDYFELVIVQNASTSTVYGSGTASAQNRLTAIRLL